VFVNLVINFIVTKFNFDLRKTEIIYQLYCQKHILGGTENQQLNGILVANFIVK